MEDKEDGRNLVFWFYMERSYIVNLDIYFSVVIRDRNKFLNFKYLNFKQSKYSFDFFRTVLFYVCCFGIIINGIFFYY